MRDTMAERLDEALARVREDIARVDFWAHAVCAFAQPVPAYDPDQSLAWFQQRPLKPARRSRSSSRRRRRSGPA